MYMEVNENNLDSICDMLSQSISKTSLITVYSGWTSQVDPNALVTDSGEEKRFRSVYPYNVSEATCIVSIGNCLNERFIRIIVVSGDSEDLDNILIKSGMNISLTDDSLVVIDSKHPLKKLLKKEDDVFSVLVF